jgi:hypothetical protein
MFIGVLIVAGLVYFIFNIQFIYTPIRSFNKLFIEKQTEETRKQQGELNKASYFEFGFDDGARDAGCNLWICSYDFNNSKSRGSIKKINKINGVILNQEYNAFYNSGYIKGYQQACPRYRADCENKVTKMKIDFYRYGSMPLYDIKDNHIVLARNVEAWLDKDRQIFYKVDDGEPTIIDRSLLNLPLQNISFENPKISANNMFILLNSVDTASGLNHLYIYEIDNKVMHKVISIKYPVYADWLPDSSLWIKQYHDTSGPNSILSEYFSINVSEPWVIKQKNVSQ